MFRCDQDLTWLELLTAMFSVLGSYPVPLENQPTILCRPHIPLFPLNLNVGVPLSVRLVPSDTRAGVIIVHARVLSVSIYRGRDKVDGGLIREPATLTESLFTESMSQSSVAAD